MAESWLVWGRGGHGRVVADLVASTGGNLAGFADRQPEGENCVAEELVVRSLSSGLPLPLGATRLALGIGDNTLRLAAWRQVSAALSPALVNPRAFISPTARLGAGTTVLPHAVVHTDAVIGEAVIINTGAIVEHDATIADGVHISPGAVLTGAVTVGECAWIGACAVVLPGVRIGARAVVGAGAVVTREVPDGMTVAGNPARPLNATSQRPKRS